MKAKMVILAGGLGTRLKPITDTIPKSMVLVKDKPFIQYQLELLKKNNITDIVIMVGHLWTHITNFVEDGRKFGLNIRCVYNQYPDPLFCLYNMRHLLDDNFMVMYGDSYLDFDYNSLYTYHCDKQNLIDNITYITMSIYKYTNYYINNVVRYLSDLNKIYYSKPGIENAGFIDYGVSVISKMALEQFSTVIINQQVTLPEFYRIISSGYTMDGYVVENKFYEIGTPESLKDFERFIDDRNTNPL